MAGPVLRLELAALARFLEFAYLPDTAALVRALANGRLPALPDGHLEALQPVLERYRTEFEGGRNLLGEHDSAYRTRLLRCQDLLLQAFIKRSTPESVLRAGPVLRAIGESHALTRELYRSFAVEAASPKHSFLNLCLMYLLMTEGVFTNLARFLLGLDRLGEGVNPTEDLWSDSLSTATLARMLREAELGVIAEGYDRHLRNAVAHGRMQYDTNTGRIRFTDVNPRLPGAPSFDEALTFLELASKYAKLDDAYLATSTYYQVHFLPLLFRIGRR